MSTQSNKIIYALIANNLNINANNYILLKQRKLDCTSIIHMSLQNDELLQN